jgi:hypothetical protein
MAVTSPIPLPQSGMDALMSGATNSQSIIDSLMNNKLIPYKAAEMQAKANQAQMRSNLINYLLGGSSSQVTPLPTGSSSLSVPPVSSSSSYPAGNIQQAGSSIGSKSPLAISPDKAAIFADMLGFPVEHQVIDGKLVTINPLSGVTTQQIGQTPIEKSQMDTSAAINQAAGKEAISRGTDLEKSAETARNSFMIYKQMQDLLNKNQNLTGWGPGIAVKTHSSKSGDLGAFHTLTIQANAELAKLASQRGGVGALKWVAGGKPSVFNSSDFNQGMINQTMNNIRQEYANINKDYRAKTGRDLNIPLEDTGGSGQSNTSVVPSNAQQNSPVNNQIANSGIVALSKGLTLPNFNTKAEFQSWFAKQTPMVQSAIRLKLQGGQ